ncbi:MAG: hypothetical protein GX442_26015 [Candidatus Riflebacteria bacterium]|nr:hypothetical protein [Candidatus Riflebacteria bacterium]
MLAVLVALPLAAWFDLGDRRRAADRETAARAVQDDLRAILAALTRQVDPLQRFEDLTRRVVTALRWGEDPTPVVRGRGVGPGTGQGAWRLFLFDGDGRRRLAPWTETGMVNASEKTLALIRRLAAAPDDEAGRSSRRLAESFLGPIDGLTRLARQPHRLHDLSELGQPRLAGVFPFRDRHRRKGFVLAIVDQGRLDLAALVRTALDRQARLAGPRFRWGLADLESRKALPAPGSDPLDTSRLDDLLRLMPVTERRTADQAEATALAGERFLVAAAAALPAPPPGFWDGRPARAGLLLAALLLLSGVSRVLAGRFVPLRLQILILFGLAAGGSLVTLLGFGRLAAQTREEGLIRDRIAETRQVLEKLDQSFSPYLVRMATRYRAIWAGTHDRTGARRGLERWTPWFRRAARAVSVHAIAGDGTVLFRQQPGSWYSFREYWGANTERLLDEIGANTVQHWNDPAGLKERSRSVQYDIQKGITIGLAGEFSAIAGRIGRFTLGHQTMRLYVDLARDGGNLAFATLLITHENNALERSFQREARRRIRALPGGRDLRFTSVLRAGVPGTYAAFRVAADERDLLDVVGVAARTNSAQSAMGWYRGRSSILVAVPGRQLRDYVLVLAAPLEPIRAEAGRLWRAFQVIAALFLGFALGVGLIFSELLLEPVEALSVGIRHLQEGRFVGFPMPATGDVLEEIGQGIQSIMEELHNLATAQAIHGQLFPPGPLTTGGAGPEGPFRLVGRTRSSSAIGDEIFDYGEAGPGRVVFWMASLPGTMLGSALGLAMTKMAFRLSTGPEAGSPAVVVRRLVGEFLDRNPGLEGAGVLLGFLDPTSGRIALAARGAFRWDLCPIGEPIPGLADIDSRGRLPGPPSEPAGDPTGRVAPDRVAPDRVAPDRVAPDRVAPDRVAPDRVAPDRVAPGSTSGAATGPSREASQAAVAEASLIVPPGHWCLVTSPGWLATRAGQAGPAWPPVTGAFPSGSPGTHAAVGETASRKAEPRAGAPARPASPNVPQLHPSPPDPGSRPPRRAGTDPNPTVGTVPSGEVPEEEWLDRLLETTSAPSGARHRSRTILALVHRGGGA